MCEPTSLMVGSLLIGATQSYVGYKAEKAAVAEQNQLAEQNRVNARVAAQDEALGVERRRDQEREAAASQKAEILTEAQKRQATATVAGGEAGVAGFSLDRTLNGIMGQAASGVDRIDQQTDWSMAELDQQQRSIQTNYKNRVNSIPTAKNPSKLNLGLAIGSQALSTYSNKFKWDQMNGTAAATASTKATSARPKANPFY